MALIIGLSGGIASGKTTVANLFNEHFDIDIIDADVIARQVVEPGSQGLIAIEQRYGSSVLNQDGTLNRQRLRETIFSDDLEKKWLNELLHPMIREKINLELTQVTSPYGLLVVPLLIENNMQSMANRVLIVDVSEQEQIERTVLRDGVSHAQAKAILRSQATREERLAVADDVIKNNTKNEKLLSQVTDLHQKYLAICGENR